MDKRRPKGQKKHGTKRQGTVGGSSDNLLKVVLFNAQRSLLEADGRCAGIKFNKLVFSIYREFSQGPDPSLRFDLPYRWYLYGAVVDPSGLGGLISFDHPEDELRSSVSWVGPDMTGCACPARAMSEIKRHCAEFNGRYHGGDLFFADMLREHYKVAPIDFQRSFLEWNLMISDMLHGSKDISAHDLTEALKMLHENFPKDLEPRLAPSFSRLYLCIEGLLLRPSKPSFDELRIIRDLFWEFWSTFCLFLSQRYNNKIHETRLRSYHERAERELLAYKRRLSAALSTAYLSQPAPKAIDTASFKELASILELRVFDRLGE